MPSDPNIIAIRVSSYDNDLISEVSVTLTYGSETLTGTTDSKGELLFDLANLTSGYTVGGTFTLEAELSGEGEFTGSYTITEGGQEIEFNLTQTSDYSFAKHGTNHLVISGSILATYDGIKVTRDNPLPVITQDPVKKYNLSDEDMANDTRYYGYLSKDGEWYITKHDSVNGTYRYVKDTSGYIAKWADRANLTYDYFDEVF